MSSEVTLGFLEESPSWRLKSHFFPSKVGGKPAWLSLQPLPTASELSCQECGNIMIFLSQIYAPYEDNWESAHNFHRTLFIFVCRDSRCNNSTGTKNFKVVRSSLPRCNRFYSSEPPVEDKEVAFDVSRFASLCSLCGIVAHQRCSKCKKVVYCCKNHQVIDWKEGHKSACGENSKDNSNSKLLFSEWELVHESEDLEEDREVNEDEALKEYNKLHAEGKTGTLKEVSSSDLDAHATSKEDKVFAMFQKRVADDPDQVIRYQLGGEPLLIASEPKPSNIPPCQYCNSPRRFEFQIMPQMLYSLKETALDWGVLLIYTCEKSCAGDSIEHYKEEFIFKQNVTNESVEEQDF